MTTSESFYYASKEEDSLRQGEIFSNVLLFRPIPGTAHETPHVLPTIYDFAILVSQDCDLCTDFYMRKNISDQTNSPEKVQVSTSKLLTQALFCEISAAKPILKELGEDTSKDLIKKNNDFRYHVLQAIEKESDAEGEGLPAMLIQFKQYFTVPMDDLLARISSKETQRRTCLNSPYFEQISSRFTYYHGRVGLPKDHKL